jgi:hypothetical protein
MLTPFITFTRAATGGLAAAGLPAFTTDLSGRTMRKEEHSFLRNVNHEVKMQRLAKYLHLDGKHAAREGAKNQTHAHSTSESKASYSLKVHHTESAESIPSKAAKQPSLKEGSTASNRSTEAAKSDKKITSATQTTSKAEVAPQALHTKTEAGHNSSSPLHDTSDLVNSHRAQPTPPSKVSKSSKEGTSETDLQDKKINVHHLAQQKVLKMQKNIRQVLQALLLRCELTPTYIRTYTIYEHKRAYILCLSLTFSAIILSSCICAWAMACTHAWGGCVGRLDYTHACMLTWSDKFTSLHTCKIEQSCSLAQNKSLEDCKKQKYVFVLGILNV